MTCLTDMITRTRIRVAAVAIGVMVSGAASAVVNLDLLKVPAEVLEGVEPNIIFTFDDSGSMSWGFLPDDAGWGGNGYPYSPPSTKRYLSPDYNLLYFNPNVAAAGGYVPAVDENGNSLGTDDKGNAITFNNACLDGILNIGCGIDLQATYEPTWRCRKGSSSCDSNGGPTLSWNNGDFYYYRYFADVGLPQPAGCTPDLRKTDDDCYIGYKLITEQEKQQFAIWFSFYRVRHLAAKTAASRAFAKLSPSVRLSYQWLWEPNGNAPMPTMHQAFTGKPRSDFFKWLFNVPTDGWTPLQRAFDRAGRKYQESGPNSPYAKVPGGSAPGDDVEYACRQNFHIAFTDGEWNRTDVFDGENPNGINDVDDSNFSLPSNSYGISGYTPKPPFKGPENKYLADIAMYYWGTDLRPDLDNNVPTYIVDKTGSNSAVFWNPRNDPANWQHMVTFTVSLGLSGNRVFDPSDPWGGGDFPALAAGTLQWGTNTVDDLWHAAVNGRGGYFTASDPQQLVDSFTKILNAIAARKGSAAAPATSFPIFQDGTLIYMPRFDSGNWTGDLVAVDVQQILAALGSGSGTLNMAQLDAIAKWHARDSLQNQSTRTILTYDPDAKKGIPFTWTAMPAGGTLQTLLNQDDFGVAGRGPDRVAYFRGDSSKEGNDPTTNFRPRQYLLGDIIHAAPKLVGPSVRLYPDTLESKPYSNFRDANCTRNRRIYVGANDGMLHAFDAGTYDCKTQTGTAGTGDEVMAYVPSAVYRTLYKLTNTDYTHRFYVDGALVTEDVYINGDWRTVLVGTLGAGGQGAFALDITTGNFSEGTASTHVLWEFTDLDDPDLGYTFAKPRIAKTNLSGGNWAVLLGNGYNNTEDDTGFPGGQKSGTGNAVLYVLDMATGSILSKLDTGYGAADPQCNNRPNGLSSPVAVDVNQDYRVDYAYAGDLCGNLWRFDLTGSNPTQWKVDRIFVASYTEGKTTYYQPITAPPHAVRHPSSAGVIVLFGTGKNIEPSDVSDNSSVNTVYGVWDNYLVNRPAFDRKSLYQQRFLDYTNSQFANTDARTSTKGGFDWYTGSGTPSPGSKTYLGWYLDLLTPDGSGGYIKEGERMVKQMLVRGNRLVFVSDIPSDDPCAAGGSSWLNELVAVSGSRLNETPFDYDDDDAFENSSAAAGGDFVDSATEGTAIAGTSIRRQNQGVLSAPIALRGSSSQCPGGEPCEKKVQGSSTAGLSVENETLSSGTEGRRSWRQIFSP